MNTNKLLAPGKVFAAATLSGSLALFAFYYLFLFAITGDPQHPISQFNLLQPWMGLLVVGFGIQLGFYFLLRQGFRLTFSQKTETKLAASGSTTISGISMVACCAHHLIDLLPILGVSSAALFLAEYQREFLIIGLIVNLFGSFYMAWLLTDKQRDPQILWQLFVSKLTQ